MTVVALSRAWRMGVFSALLLALGPIAASADQFPMGPNPILTPGVLCTQPDSYRYPEHIPYCSRAVTTDAKDQIIQIYDQQLGYSITSLPREDFKIDHLIPLCAGGANDLHNLWPQHKSVYTITDPLEPLICEKMAEGKLRQSDAIAIILAGKRDLSKVAGLMAQLNSL